MGRLTVQDPGKRPQMGDSRWPGYPGSAGPHRRGALLAGRDMPADSFDGNARLGKIPNKLALGKPQFCQPGRVIKGQS